MALFKFHSVTWSITGSRPIMQKNANHLAWICKPAIAGIVLLSIAGCDGGPASKQVDLTKVSRMACNSDGTLPSAWETGGLIISLNQPDGATLLMAAQSFTFAGRYQATPTTLTMTFLGGVDAAGNISRLKSPSVKTIESVKVIGQDKDGWPHIETSGFKLKCIVEIRKPVSAQVAVERPAIESGTQAPVDPITEDVIVNSIPPAANPAEPEVRTAPETIASDAGTDPKQTEQPRFESHPMPAIASESNAGTSSTQADKESRNDLSLNAKVLKDTGLQLASYHPRLVANVVKLGLPVRIDSTAELVTGQEPVNEVREELIVSSPEGKPFKSGAKQMVRNGDEKYVNSFTLTLPQDAAPGVYGLRTKLYLNGLLVSTRDLRVQLE